MRPLPVEPAAERVLIGGRLRAARHRQGLSIDALAASSGLTKSFLSRVERDLTSPSVSSLVRMCQVLSVDIGSLFREPEIFVVRGKDGPRINLGGVGATERLLTSRGESQIQLIRSFIAPGGHGGEVLYTMLSNVEVLHVLSGRLHLAFTNDSVELSAGDSVTFPGSEPHTWRNPDAALAAEVIWAFAPAAWSGTSPTAPRESITPSTPASPVG